MDIPDQQAKGERAEQVASWYFRLNGFFSVPGYIVHPDQTKERPYAEADLIAVRFPHSVEKIKDFPMRDDPCLIRLANSEQTLFVLVEVKAGQCSINASWEEEWRGNIQRVVRRLGFTEEHNVESVAEQMYQSLRWENDNYILQYLVVGRDHNPQL